MSLLHSLQHLLMNFMRLTGENMFYKVLHDDEPSINEYKAYNNMCSICATFCLHNFHNLFV